MPVERNFKNIQNTKNITNKSFFMSFHELAKYIDIGAYVTIRHIMKHFYVKVKTLKRQLVRRKSTQNVTKSILRQQSKRFLKENEELTRSKKRDQ